MQMPAGRLGPWDLMECDAVQETGPRPLGVPGAQSQRPWELPRAPGGLGGV